MKKYFCFLCILLLSLSFPVSAAENTEAESTIEPRASYVFHSVGSGISRSGYAGDCALVGVGSGTLKVRLQKYSSSSGSWTTVAGPYSKSFSDTMVCALSKSKTLSTGKYRCRTDVTAKVGSYTDSRTVYSSTLTIN
jgi:hypothetical protein